MRKKVMLIVMDGLGVAPNTKGNAVSVAKPTNLSQFWNTYPHTYLLASAQAVGLPKGVKGNSEVGHMNLGAGNVVSQNLPRINKAIEKDLFKTNNTLWDALKHSIKYKSKIHLMTCFSDGSVHAHTDHLKAVLDFFVYQNFTGEIILHAFTDGRDSSPNSSHLFFEKFDEYFKKHGLGRFGTIIGRSLAMDRNQTWERTKRAYEMLTQGIGQRFDSWKQTLESSYNNGLTDEFIQPSIIGKSEDNRILENDVVIYLNYRSDRAIQLAEAFLKKDFTHFPVTKYKNLFFAGMVEYRKSFPDKVLFPKEYIALPLGKIISEHGLRQLRIAESEKFPHVTYFFNGGTAIRYQGEDRVEIQSPKVATYDLKPEMSALELTDVLLQRIMTNVYDFILVNFANTDMVGHTGNILASIKAVGAVDQCVSTITRRFIASGGSVLITSDHGNVEEIINLKTGEIDTEHSINPVPFIVVDQDMSARVLPYGALKDVAPTVLDLMGLPIPAEITGKSLISFNEL